jgi:hypothetical protein
MNRCIAMLAGVVIAASPTRLPKIETLPYSESHPILPTRDPI